jgi:UDP-N-acetylglucosamine--N-acetylmuramyl-(pentapeptide) pyrophosphoryl-undecaprenol N-acetylglucosamine transferase
VYPALAIWQALKSKSPHAEVLWVGGKGGMEKDLVARSAIPFKAVSAAGVHGVGLTRLPGNVIQLIKGWIEARKIITDFKPDVILFTGGFVAAPIALVSAFSRIPALVCVPDIEPGLALTFLSRIAKRIVVPTEDSKKYFDPNMDVRVTGYPVRSDLASIDHLSALKKFEFADILPVVLIFGGSKGARSINFAVIEHLETLLAFAQVIHISGSLDWDTVAAAQKNLPEDLAQNYRAFPYLHEEMGMALAAADLVVSRAGASTIGEFPAFELPAVLVPYPHAWRYQKVNADYLARNGAAIILEDEKLKSGLAITVDALLRATDRLLAMGKAMQALNRPEAAAVIADHLRDLAGEKN